MENMFPQSESTPQDSKNESSPSLIPPTLEKDEVVYDECFIVRESRFGLFNSTTLKGRKMLCSPTLEECIKMTRWHLKCEQEGWPEGSVVVKNSKMGVKL